MGKPVYTLPIHQRPGRVKRRPQGANITREGYGVTTASHKVAGQNIHRGSLDSGVYRLDQGRPAVRLYETEGLKPFD